MRCYQTCMRPCESLLWICILLANLPQNLKEWRGTSCKPLIPTCPLQKKTYWKGRCTHQFHLPCWFYDKQLELQQMAWDGKQWKTTFKNNICISTPLNFLACTRRGLKRVGMRVQSYFHWYITVPLNMLLYYMSEPMRKNTNMWAYLTLFIQQMKTKGLSGYLYLAFWIGLLQQWVTWPTHPYI